MLSLKRLAISLVGLILLSAATVKADSVTFVLSGADFSGTTNNTGGNLTVTILDIGAPGSGQVQITVANNLIDPGAFVGTLWLSTSVAPLAGTSVACGVAPGCTQTPLPIVSFGSNAFQADGAGTYDIQIAFATGNPDRLIPGETIVFTITSTTAGFNALSFNSLPGPGGGNTSREAAAHIQGLPPSNSQSDFITNNGTPVPEPTGMLLLGTGLIGVAGVVRRKLNNVRR